MQIDFNPKECQAMEAFKRGDPARGSALQGEFIEELKQFKRDHGDHCSCPADCSLHGNCMICVQVHRGHGDHLPFCLQCMVNRKLAALSELTEHSLTDMIEKPAYLGGGRAAASNVAHIDSAIE